MPFSECRSLSWGEAGRWNLSVCSLMGREVLTVTGCCLVRGSTCRSTAFIVNNSSPIGVYLISASFYNWDQDPRGILSFCFCQNAQPMPFGVTETSNSDGNLAWKTLRSLICFTSTFYLFKGSLLVSPLDPHVSLTR